MTWLNFANPQIDDVCEMAFTERIELAEIRNERNCEFLQDLYGRKFDFTKRLFIAKSRFDANLATYYHLDDNGSFVRAVDLNSERSKT